MMLSGGGGFLIYLAIIGYLYSCKSSSVNSI